ncbi:MAG: CHASE2 domain-containing protein [Candidatus Moranbacteria bacterium]|nr:CHASE2 domain-containing protein [Candidatus Moranbacteria bacterium]
MRYLFSRRGNFFQFRPEKTKNSSRFFSLIGFISALLIALILGVVFYFDFFYTFREKITDKLFLASEPKSPIVIIAIDNQSIQAFNQWPFDREIHAQIIDKLNQGQAALIGYDVNFAQPSQSQADQALKNSIERAGNVFLPLQVHYYLEQGQIKLKNLIKPMPDFIESAQGLGLANVHPDFDGVIRRAPLFINSFRENYYSLPWLLAQHFQSKQPDSNLIKPRANTSNYNSLFRINYVGPPGAFKNISAKNLLQANFDPEVLKNQIVLVGSTAADLNDEYMTPVSNGKPMSGVEILANQLATILNANYLSTVSKPEQILIFLLLGLLVAVLFTRLSLFGAILGSISVFGIYVIFALVLFDHGLILDLLFPLLLISLLIFLL